MAFCTKCASNNSTMAIRCEHCQYGFTESCREATLANSNSGSQIIVGDSVLLAGAVACGGLSFYVGLQSLGAVFNGELLLGLFAGPAAIAVLSAMMVSFWRVAR